jgi:hypothetical protein
MTNLLLTILHHVGSEVDALGDSTGLLSPDQLSV